jgi:hypothetical protein
LEGLEPATLNFREVSEEIVAACVRGDEAEALGVVEPLYCAGFHVGYPKKFCMSLCSSGTTIKEETWSKGSTAWRDNPEHRSNCLKILRGWFLQIFQTRVNK